MCHDKWKRDQCYGLILVFSKNSYVEALILNATIVGDRAYGEVIVKWGHKGGAIIQ